MGFLILGLFLDCLLDSIEDHDVSRCPVDVFGQDLRLAHGSLPGVVVVGKDFANEVLEGGLRLEHLLLQSVGVLVTFHSG